MSIGKSFRAWLLSVPAITAAVGNRIHENAAPETYAGPYIWFARATTDDDEALTDAAGTRPFRELFDVEIHAKELEDVETIAELLRDRHCHRGTMGSGTAQAVFVRDHKGDYEQRGIASDEQLHGGAFEFVITGYSE